MCVLSGMLIRVCACAMNGTDYADYLNCSTNTFEYLGDDYETEIYTVRFTGTVCTSER